MLFHVILLIILFFILDTYFYNKEKGSSPKLDNFSIKIQGKSNFILILCIVGAVIISGLPELQRSIFTFIIYSGYIFSHNAKCNKLDTT